MEKSIDKDLMAKGYIEMGELNLNISNDYLLSEEQGYNRGVENIAI